MLTIIFARVTVTSRNVALVQPRIVWVQSTCGTEQCRVCLQLLSFVLQLQQHPFNGSLSGTTRVSWYQQGKTSLDFTEKKKGKKSVYIAPFTVIHSKRSGVHHTVLPANNTMPAFPSWAFTRCHHHSNCGSRFSSCSLLLIYRPQKDERLSWPRDKRSKRQWVAVASAGPYASLHLALDRHLHQHPTITGWMPFLPYNQQR